MAIDFTNVKAITIPEGSVKQIAIGGTTVWTAINMPAKGAIIDIDIYGDSTTKRFRVLSTSGTTAKLLALDDGPTKAWTSDTTTTFDDGTFVGLDYSASNPSSLCTYYNTTYYSSLSTAMKNAIIPTTRVQSAYGYASGSDPSATFNLTRLNNSTYAYTRYTQRTAGTYNCFAIDIDDIVDYLEVAQGGTMSGAQLNLMFFEQTTATTSAKTTITSSVNYWHGDSSIWEVEGEYGFIGGQGRIYSKMTRPCMNVDLTKINFTIE